MKKHELNFGEQRTIKSLNNYHTYSTNECSRIIVECFELVSSGNSHEISYVEFHKAVYGLYSHYSLSLAIDPVKTIIDREIQLFIDHFLGNLDIPLFSKANNVFYEYDSFIKSVKALFTHFDEYMIRLSTNFSLIEYCKCVFSK